MLWRFNRLLHHPTTTKSVHRIFFCSFYHRILSSQVPQSNSTENSDYPFEHYPRRAKPIALTHDVVYSTLMTCPSDLIALSFFIWAAKQPGYAHDSRSFDRMVGVIGSLTRRFGNVGGIVDELESVGCAKRAQIYLLLLRVYWRGGMFEMIFDAVDEMGRAGFTPNTFARNVVMDVLFRNGNVEAGMRVLNETPVPNFLSFNIALCNLCKLNDAVRVKDVLRVMLKKGYYPNGETFEMVLKCFCKIGWMDEVYQVLGVITTLGVRLTVSGWSILIDGFCRLRKLDTAAYLLEKMVKSGCSPNVVTFTSLIKGLFENKMDSHAFRSLKVMVSKGIVPDLVLYNVLIDRLSKIGRYSDAIDIFVGLSKQKLVPDCYSISSLLSALCLSRRFLLSPKLVSKLVADIDLDLVTFNTMLNYLCKAGFPNSALKLYKHMVIQGLIPDQYSFVGLLSGLCGARRYKEAVNVYQGILMQYPAVDAHVHTIFVDELVRAGKYCRAIELFKRARLSRYSLDVVTYTVAICGLLKSGRIGEVPILYSQMKEIGLSPNAYTYNTMLFGFCKEKDIKMVQQLLEEIIEGGFKLNRSAFIRATSFVFKYHATSPALNLLIEICNLGLIPKEVTCLSSLDGLYPPAKVGNNANQEFSKDCLEDNLLPDTSSSDELSDVVASVG